MTRSLKHFLITCALLSAWIAAPAWAEPLVEIKTNQGSIIVELNSKRAPRTVANFLTYVKEHHYDGTIFHRVISNFMIQGGGFTPGMDEKPTHAPIRNEADNGLTNSIGSIAMARTNDPHSATAQFYINVANNSFLNYTESSERGWGYTVFGRVVSGMDVVQRIARIPTDGSDVPLQTVLIQSVNIIEPPVAPAAAK